MNEQTAALVSQLAAKLGTTSEYLWGVLLKQAAIQGWIMLLQYSVTLIVLVAFFRFRSRLSAAWHSWVEAEEVSAVVGIVVIGLVMTIWLIACVFTVESMLTAFLNPEYWALERVLSAVKK